ncbi:hypothetical protein HJG60_012186 [Phyllostomus discolor]|uniref:Uncharacterized protein n=1 Tax=Phyllostomus discolor TaxID=89673 RepID=A0A833Z649_9CHIR|nr:hypothetical protein HJG60_012186 [Phyllostomus discolor]
MSPHTGQNGPSINQQTISAGEDMKRGEPFCTVGVNRDWCSHCGKQYGDTSKKLKMASIFLFHHNLHLYIPQLHKSQLTLVFFLFHIYSCIWLSASILQKLLDSLVVPLKRPMWNLLRQNPFALMPLG